MVGQQLTGSIGIAIGNGEIVHCGAGSKTDVIMFNWA